jgi:HAD superfamily hydrolase (TIGR01549 family)
MSHFSEIGERRLVLFDLDNTLIDRAGGFLIWARAFAARHGLAESEVEWLELLDNDGLTKRTEFFRAARERYALQDSVENLVKQYREEYPRCVPPLPDETRSALADLRAAGWRIGIASNGAPSQETKILTTGLDKLVDGWAISEVVGVRKPDTGLFQAAADACHGRLRDAWMVGDSAEADIAGASTSGMSSVWISRGRTWRAAIYSPTLVAASVAEAASEILVRDSVK